jgi:L-rhamnose mutarotase
MRIAFKMRLKPGCETTYKEKHDAIWPELVALIRQSGTRNYSIFREGLDLFAYLESDQALPTGGEVDPVLRDWWLMMEPSMEYNDDHTPKIWPMEETFHLD